MTKKLFVFDLDGVLIDSKENMRLSWLKVCKKFKLDVSFDEYFNNIGKPFQVILTDLKIENDQELIEKEYNNSSIENEDKIIFYKNVPIVLNKLVSKNILVSICTSKDSQRTERILKNLPVKFDSINCPNLNLKGKPFPDQLIQASKVANVELKNTTYIGDTIVDKKTAENAGIKFIYASYGYGNLKNIKNKINKFDDILAYT